MTDDELDQRLRDSILSEEIDTARVASAVRNQIQPRPRHVPGWAVAAAALIVTALAATFSYQTFRGEQTPALCSAAIQDHEREIVKGDPRRWISDLPAIQVLAEKQSVPSMAVTALETAGYRLERGRLCMLQKQIFLHLVYTKGGSQYSVYLRPLTAEPSFNNSVQGAGTLAYFQTKRVTVMFVSQGAGVQAFARAAVNALQDLPS